MRKASYVLGIVGGCLALIIAFVSLISGLFILMGGQAIFSEITSFLNQVTRMNYGPWNFLSGNFIGWIGGLMVLYVCAMSLSAGILGLIGAVSVNKNNVKAGVLMLVGAGLCFITPAIGFIPMVLLILGGIFALVKEKPAQNGQAQQ